MLPVQMQDLIVGTLVVRVREGATCVAVTRMNASESRRLDVCARGVATDREEVKADSRMALGKRALESR